MYERNVCTVCMYVCMYVVCVRVRVRVRACIDPVLRVTRPGGHGVGAAGGPEDGLGVQEAVRPGPARHAAPLPVERPRHGSGETREQGLGLWDLDQWEWELQ